MDILFALFLFFSNPVEPAVTQLECSRYVIGFRGLNSAFDQAAFDQYVAQRQGCGRVYNYTQAGSAVEFVESINQPYELYGYSAGAVAVGQVLKQARRRPDYIITVGALATVNVDFSQYGIKFDNWFDDSGRGSRSSGRYLPGVAHDRIQAHVNQYYK
jgi:hypothetical protein